MTIEAAHEAERAATLLDQHLQAGGSLIPVPAPGLVLDEGEAAYADVACGVARWYATEVVHPPGAGYFEDHPAFGRRWVPNHRLDARRQQQAEADAQARWREHCQARAVLTSDGFRVLPDQTATWLPFDHALLTGITVIPTRHELVLSYSVCAPLLLSGLAASWLAVAVQSLSPSTPVYLES
ncbi:hypothetical protein ACFCY8_13145 [Streptomyces noursei]|uniref:hypothetical protein n=1 Tax=Streptomyces noursei TaxID=1971 RepID=UPI0035DBE5EE